MVLTTGHRGLRVLPWLRLAALLPISLLLGHEAVFATQYGTGDAFTAAMAAGGHTAYWQAFSVVILALTVGLLARAGLRAFALRWQLHALARITGPLPGAPTGPTRAAGPTDATAAPTAPASDAPAAVPAWRAEVRRIWPVLFLATAVAFGVLENLEHMAAGLAPHGLGSLVGSEHPTAIPVLAVVSALVAAVGSLVRWRLRVLEARVARARRAARFARPTPLAPAREWPRDAALRTHAWFLVRPSAGRAPPRVA